MVGRRWFGALAVALALAACGGSAAPTSAPSSTTSTTGVTTTTVAPPVSNPTTTAVVNEREQLATELTTAERDVRDPLSPESKVIAAARRQQLLYRRLGLHPEWDAAVMARIPADLREAVRLNLVARREFRAMHPVLEDTLPAWKIVPPPSSAELLRAYHDAETEFGVPWEYLAAVNFVETVFGRIRGTSTAGAQGPMQFLPATWDAFGAGGDINDTHDAIFGAARYLAHNGGGSGNIDGALFNYNHSDHYVTGVKAYADVLRADPHAFAGYYQWRVIYLTTEGDVVLPEGYKADKRIPVKTWLGK